MKFTKMQGCGNDYVYVNGFVEKIDTEAKPDIVRRLSDRHFGIGGDGVIFINPSEIADFEMEMFNADGSRSQMCGNGIRCVAKYVYDYGLTDKTSLTIESFGAIKYIDLTVENGKVVVYNWGDYIDENILTMFEDETGAKIDIEKLTARIKEKNPRTAIHIDAVQSFMKYPLDVKKLKIESLSFSAHKVNGPKGIGVMDIRKGVKILSYIHGGAQERRRRAGTHNVPGIVGMGKAVEIAAATMDEKAKSVSELRDYLIEQVLEKVPHARLNGHKTNRLPNNANFCFRFIEGEGMLIMLDQAGICGSSGSACTSGSLDPSHVLLAIGLPHEIAHGSLRLTLSEDTTKEEIDYTVDKLAEIIARLRSMSPLYEDFVKKNS